MVIVAVASCLLQSFVVVRDIEQEISEPQQCYWDLG